MASDRCRPCPCPFAFALAPFAGRSFCSPCHGISQGVTDHDLTNAGRQALRSSGLPGGAGSSRRARAFPAFPPRDAPYGDGTIRARRRRVPGRNPPMSRAAVGGARDDPPLTGGSPIGHGRLLNEHAPVDRTQSTRPDDERAQALLPTDPGGARRFPISARASSYHECRSLSWGAAEAMGHGVGVIVVGLSLAGGMRRARRPSTPAPTGDAGAGRRRPIRTSTLARRPGRPIARRRRPRLVSPEVRARACRNLPAVKAEDRAEGDPALRGDGSYVDEPGALPAYWGAWSRPIATARSATSSGRATTPTTCRVSSPTIRSSDPGPDGARSRRQTPSRSRQASSTMERQTFARPAVFACLEKGHVPGPRHLREGRVPHDLPMTI